MTGTEELKFTAVANCDNCDGTGTFSSIDRSTGERYGEPCAFCLEDAIIRGELDGEVAGVHYIGGVRQQPALTLLMACRIALESGDPADIHNTLIEAIREAEGGVS